MNKIKLTELLKLVEEFNPPEKIQVEDLLFIYNKDYNCIEDLYLTVEGSRWITLINLKLDTPITIISDDPNWIDIQELPMASKQKQSDNIMDNRYIINQLIKNQNRLKERLEDDIYIRTKAELYSLIDERIESRR